MIGQTISHYRVLSRVGSGGMGVVYEAEDLELGRHVAVKFLSATLATDPQAVERFRREARAASALSHPHICTIHDIGLHDGQPFIVMELLQGQTLRGIQPGPLEPGLLIDVAVQIADALEAAHASGFIHRDIKPANVFLTNRGEAKLLDFGLAKLFHQRPGAPEMDADEAPTVAAERMTQEGVIVGTIAYMSPEQMRGEELDGRTDLFSLGALLYELATGREPFIGKTDVLVSDAILHEDPTPPSRLNPDLHPDLERIIRKALEKDRRLRYQSAGEMRADLQRLKRDSGGARAMDSARTGAAAPREVDRGVTDVVVPPAGSPASAVLYRRAGPGRRTVFVGAGLLLVTIAAAGVAYRFVWRAPVLAERDSIVLANFDNTTGDAVFDETLRQALSMQLQQSPFLTVLGGERVATTLRLMGRPSGERLSRTIAREVCQRETAKAMVAGSIAPLGANYVITLEGINCVTGDVFATVQGEARGKEDVLHALGTCASEFRARLGETLPSIQKYDVPIRQAATASLDALKLFSAAMVAREEGDNVAAVPLLARAVEVDPDFALAWANLSATLGAAGRRAESEEALARAFALRDRVPEQERYYISHRYYVMTGEIDKVIETNQMWAKVYPRSWTPHDSLCKQYWQVWDTERALAECREALRLEPGSVYPYDGLVEFNMALGRFDEAGTVAAQLLATGISDAAAHGYLARIAWLEGDGAVLERERAWLRASAASDFEDLEYAMAVAAGRLREAAGIRPVRPDDLAWVGSVEAARNLAEAMLGEWQRQTPSGRPSPNAALALALAGDDVWIDKIAAYIARAAPRCVLMNNAFMPCVRAALELSRGNGTEAVELLEPARRHGFGFGNFNASYLRGLGFLYAAHPQEAASEFEQIIAHRGVAPGSVLWPLAHLGLARARALAGDAAAARSAYGRFLTLWKDADPDLPVLQEAKREYDRLGPVIPES